MVMVVVMIIHDGDDGNDAGIKIEIFLDCFNFFLWNRLKSIVNAYY